jgi:glycosyltransferase involved in cell wall biosynthesis
VGEAGRLLVRGLEAAGVPLITETLVGTGNRKTVEFAERPGDREACRVVIVCDNADGVQRYAAACPPGYLGERYVIGLWFWEVERFPASMLGGFDVVDEVWVASEHVRRALARERRRPVRRVAVPLPVPGSVDPLPRSEYGLPQGFLFLVCFDHASVLSRKNPQGAISAFLKAFPAGDEPAALAVKSINADHFPEAGRMVREAAQGDPRIVFIDRYLAAAEQLRLIATADAYVSLHRAEGLGLPMAEAMSLGKPVIATGYSGNLAFMHSSNSLLVPSHLVPVPPDAQPYPSDARWAEPDVEAASALMRRLLAEGGLAGRIGVQARSSLLAEHSETACASGLRRALAAAERRALWRRSAAHAWLRRARSLARRGRRSARRASGSIRRRLPGPPGPRPPGGGPGNAGKV